MALYLSGRLGSKSMLSALNKFPSIIGTVNYAAAAGVPKITYKKFEKPIDLHPNIRSEQLKRPLSPHLSIYSPQLTSMMSITHRISGMLLSGYISVLGIGALALPNDVSHYVTMLEGLHLSSVSLFLLKFVIAAPFSYHFFNGVRHLYWDTAKGLTIKDVYKTGYAVLGFTIASTIALAAL